MLVTKKKKKLEFIRQEARRSNGKTEEAVENTDMAIIHSPPEF